MADNKLLQQMLESLVNDDQAKAEELFHEYVVQQSREIYESMIDSEIAEEKDEEDEEDEEVKEASEDDEEDDDLDENFEDVAIEGDDDKMGDMGGDPTDDLEAELDADMDDEGDDMGDKSEEELFQDLDSIVDELQAKFDELKGDDMGDLGDDEKMKDDFDLATVREYVEKVAPAKMGDNGVNAKSIVAGKNDMGGTAANIVGGGESKGEGTKGGLLNPAAKEDNAGNINVPGGKAGNAFSKKEPGHGAEKAGAKESADNKQSIFRGRR
jgi:hypothetical protein